VSLVHDAQPILVQLQAMLTADGYELVAAPGAHDRELLLTVVAGDDACVECMIPAVTFRAIAEKYLADGGLDAQVSVIYPDARPDA
jgi:hypothetical protein